MKQSNKNFRICRYLDHKRTRPKHCKGQINFVEILRNKTNHFEDNSTQLSKSDLSQTLFGNPKGPVELGNPNTCAETKLCLNFILFRLKK